MVFERESATGVPREQRLNYGRVYLESSTRTWAPRRALRGFVTTALFALFTLRPGRAHAQASARFEDVPNEARAAAQAAAPSAQPVPAPAVTAAGASAAAQHADEAPPVGFNRRLALAHLERGEQLERRADIAQALREYTACIAIDSQLGEAYLRLGALRERMGEPREADLVYSEAARLGEVRSKALLQRARLRRSVGRSELALSDLEAAVELDPSLPLLEELAHEYVEHRAWSAALAVFRRIIARASEDKDATALETARLELRALRVLAAETDPLSTRPAKHDWIGRALRSIARRE